MTRFLIFGHPRSGTSYMAALMRHLGYEVGHEKMMRDGVSYVEPLYWPARWGITKTESGRPAFRNNYDTKIIHVVRNPRDVVASIYGMTFGVEGPNMTPHIPELMKFRDNAMEHTLMSIVLVHRDIANIRPDLLVRVEDAAEVLPRWLPTRRTVGALPPTDFNHKQHKELTDDDWAKVSPPIMSNFLLHEAKYGYKI